MNVKAINKGTLIAVVTLAMLTGLVGGSTLKVMYADAQTITPTPTVTAAPAQKEVVEKNPANAMPATEEEHCDKK